MDGTPDCLDNCPNDLNKIIHGLCGCGVLDVDSDGDGILDCLDPCPVDANDECVVASIATIIVDGVLSDEW